MTSKSCWDIMECGRAEECIAKQDPRKECWEHAQIIGAAPDHFSLCPDCLVYLVNRPKSSFNIKEITQKRKTLAAFRSHQRCALAGYVDYKSAVAERREKKRFLCNGFLHASLSMSDIFNFSCHLVDLSQTGLAFVCKGSDLIREKDVFLNLSMNTVTVQDLPVQIISDYFSSSPRKQTRYGARFHGLTADQQSGLSSLIQTCAGG